MKILVDDPDCRYRLFKCDNITVLSTSKDVIEIFQIVVEGRESGTLIRIGLFKKPGQIISIYDYLLIQILYDIFGNIDITNLGKIEDVLIIRTKNEPSVYTRNYHDIGFYDYGSCLSSSTDMYFQEYTIACGISCYEQTDPYYQWATYGRNYF